MKFKVPKSVQEHLLPDEDVIGRFSTIWREYYATDKHLIGFGRPDWVQVFLVLGILPGILAILLTRKVYLGTLEYSKISEVNRVLLRQVVLVALGIILGVPMVIGGIFVLATAEYPGGGWVLLIMGAFVIIALWLGRPSFYQLKIADLPKAQKRKWFISKSKGLQSKNSADRFAELIMTMIRK